MNIDKLRRSVLLPVLATLAMGIAACSNTPPATSPASPTPGASPATAAWPSPSPATTPATAPGAPSSKVDALAGNWEAPDRTSLTVTKKDGKYTLEFANREIVKSFDGTSKGDSIEFTRDGKPQTIRPVTGAETGVKGLETETNCVVVVKGKEAYCRK